MLLSGPFYNHSEWQELFCCRNSQIETKEKSLLSIKSELDGVLTLSNPSQSTVNLTSVIAENVNHVRARLKRLARERFTFRHWVLL